MLKRILSACTAGAVLLGLGISANADEIGWKSSSVELGDKGIMETDSSAFDYSISDEKVSITKYKGSIMVKEDRVVIPSEIDGKPVVEIGDGAFYKSSVSRIEIPDSVVSIGKFAFSENKSLSSVKLSNSLKELGMGAFQNCTELQKVVLPKCLLKVEAYTFNGCVKLSNVDMYKGISSIDSMSFANCNNLQGIVIPNTVKNIGTYAFDSCICLKNVIIPNGVTVIEAGAFYNCQSLNSIYLPKSVSFIDISVFKNCKNLKSVVVENSTVDYFDSALFEVGEFSRIFTDCPNVVLYGSRGSTTEKHAQRYRVSFSDKIGNVAKSSFGDIDLDGSVSAGDALSALRESVGLEYLTDYQKRVADIDEDGTVTSADSLSILRYSVGLNNSEWE